MSLGVALSLTVGATVTSVASPGIVVAETTNPFVGLRQGASGPHVKTLQRALVAKGAYLRGGIDGVFGPGTTAAVRAFQQVNGLPRTGTVDAATARWLGVSAPSSGAEASSTSTGGAPAPASHPEWGAGWDYGGGYVGLRIGAQHSDVADVQRALIAAGVYLPGGADSSFGNATKAAIESFQNRKGLPASGVVDGSTAVALGLRSGTSGGSTSATPSLSGGTGGLRQGAQGDVVRAVQQAIVRSGGFLLGGVDGVYGPGTASAVRAYQIVNRLPVTGVVDGATARVMGVTLGSVPSTPGGASALRLGARGEAVRAMQRALINVGIYVLGGADGIFGPGTLSAIKSFQQRKGLPATGIYDDATRRALLGTGSGGTPPPPATDGYIGLRQGSRGPLVRELQQAIMRTGLYLMGGADGIFGPATTSALKIYQRVNGLSVTGVVDAATVRVMGLGSGPSDPRGGGDTAPGYPKYGEQGERVRALQIALRGQGISFAGGVDGIFGSATTGAVIRFQQSNGLVPTGRIDADTARALGLRPMQAPAPPDTSNIRIQHHPITANCWYGDTWHAPRGGGRLHMGVDIIADQGTPLYAVVGGRITAKIKDQPGSLSGNALKVGMNDGTYFFYAHLSRFASGIGVGVPVRAGQVIGYVGSTGNSAGPHLHLEVHPRGGVAVNPYPIMRAAGVCGIR